MDPFPASLRGAEGDVATHVPAQTLAAKCDLNAGCFAALAMTSEWDYLEEPATSRLWVEMPSWVGAEGMPPRLSPAIFRMSASAAFPFAV